MILIVGTSYFFILYCVEQNLGIAAPIMMRNCRLYLSINQPLINGLGLLLFRL